MNLLPKIYRAFVGLFFTVSLSFILISQVNNFSDVYANNCVINNEGLVSWWTFDEINGEIVKDSAGDNDGTMINGPYSIEGKINNGLYFDGEDDEVRVPASDNLNIVGDVTVELWAKLNSIDNILSKLK